MKRKIVLYLFLVFGAVNIISAADDDTSKQLQMLNSQIQSQLQQIQEKQKNQDIEFNKQIQSQLKQIQSDIQKQIADGYNKTQAQIKKVQDTLQGQIKQVSEDAIKESKATAVTK